MRWRSGLARRGPVALHDPARLERGGGEPGKEAENLVSRAGGEHAQCHRAGVEVSEAVLSAKIT